MRLGLLRVGVVLVGLAVAAGTAGLLPDTTPMAQAAEGGTFPTLLSTRDRALYGSAFKLGGRGDWDGAAAMAAAARDRTLAKVIDWQRIQDRSAMLGFDQIARFIDQNPDWPRSDGIQVRAEAKIDDDTGARKVIDFFRRHPPISGLGRLRYGMALLETGDRAAGAQLLKLGWHDADTTPELEQQVLSRHGALLGETDHVARLDQLLFDESVAEARRMLPLVPAAWRAEGQARISLILAARTVTQDLAQVPAARRNDSGLLYARIRWLRALDRDDEATDLIALLPAGTAAAAPEDWWPNLHYGARRLLRAGRPEEAYRVASQHGLTGGVAYFEAEWMAGWIALRFLNRPEIAYRHFSAMRTKVSAPISVSRAAFWAGRAAAAAGRAADARRWFDDAAAFPHTFYGQLAAATLGEVNARPLAPDPAPTPQDRTAFESDELIRAARMLLEIGEENRIRPFTAQIMENQTRPGVRALVTAMAEAKGGSFAGIVAAKAANYLGTTLFRHGYPVVAMPRGALTEPALALALTRQESEFRVDAVSPAGALGLMQLMPSTAKLVARSLGIKYQPKKLTTDASYNTKLGVAHLDQLLNDYSGSYIMTAAAYNAGPGRVSSWMNEFGDPRSAATDVIDWIEQIPFTETRNYVQRVIENTQVYRQRLAGKKPVPLEIYRDLLRGAGGRRSPMLDIDRSG